MVRKKLTLILFTAALAQNLQVIKQRMAKAAQGDLTNLVKMKTEKKHTWRVELLLVPRGGQDILEDDRPSSFGILIITGSHSNLFQGNMYRLLCSISCSLCCKFCSAMVETQL
jgi:hypothetical protein